MKNNHTWYRPAAEKLKAESGKISDQKEKMMAGAVKDALLEFCRQSDEFAQAVAQGSAFSECMKAVAESVGNGISDLEAYRRAVKFYFPGAGVHMTMRIDLCDSVRDAPRSDGGAISLNLSDFL